MRRLYREKMKKMCSIVSMLEMMEKSRDRQTETQTHRHTDGV